MKQCLVLQQMIQKSNKWICIYPSFNSRLHDFLCDRVIGLIVVQIKVQINSRKWEYIRYWRTTHYTLKCVEYKMWSFTVERPIT